MEDQQLMACYEAVNHVFGTMLQCEVTTEGHVVQGGADAHQDVDVAAVIGVHGERTGAIALSFPQQTAERLASLLVESNVTLHDEELADAIGELANMVAGNAKSAFDGIQLEISCPSIVFDLDQTAPGEDTAVTRQLHCESDCGWFIISLALASDDIPQPGAAS